MALVVEDGSIVSGANSYVDLTDARAYAAARGVTLSSTDADVEVLAIGAMDYLEQLDYAGSIVDADQPLLWPRTGVYIRGYLFDYSSIPQRLVDAQCQLMMAQHNSVSLYANLSADGGGFVTREKVGPIETEYATPADGGYLSAYATLPQVDALLKPLLAHSGGFAVGRA